MGQNVDTEIQFSGLKPGIYTYDYTLDDSFFSDYKNEKILGGKVVFSVRMEKKERMLLFNFAYSGKVRTTCDRCLGEMPWPVEGSEMLCVKFSDTEQSDDEEVVIMPEAAYKIDIAQWLYEFVAVKMPIQCLHPDDKEGRSTCDPEMLKYLSDGLPEDGEQRAEDGERSGENGGIDPRWEALRRLRDGD